MDSVVSVGQERPLPWEESVKTLLGYLLTVAPLLLVVTFALGFVVHSITSARSTPSNPVIGTGPGGRPLPRRTRSAAVVHHHLVQGFSPTVKTWFKWLCVSIIMVFTIDAAVNIAHAILYRHQQWWCGQATVVRPLMHMDFYVLCCTKY